MGISGWPTGMLKGLVSKGSIMNSVGGFVTGKLMARFRQQWEQTKASNVEALLQEITPYEIGRGAGLLIADWLTYSMRSLDLPLAEKHLQTLLALMDKKDHLPEERARSRFVISKVLFRLEGFKLSRCRYETYQSEAWALLRKNPRYRAITRNDLFRGTPFVPEELIATTHRMLLELDNGHLADYIQAVVQRQDLKTDADYMAYLIAITLKFQDEALPKAINDWFELYCDFKIAQTHQRESLINTSLSAATGGLPAAVGMDLLGRLANSVVKKRG
jgi:hypothetical protein